MLMFTKVIRAATFGRSPPMVTLPATVPVGIPPSLHPVATTTTRAASVTLARVDSTARLFLRSRFGSRDLEIKGIRPLDDCGLQRSGRFRAVLPRHARQPVSVRGDFAIGGVAVHDNTTFLKIDGIGPEPQILNLVGTVSLCNRAAALSLQRVHENDS